MWLICGLRKLLIDLPVTQFLREWGDCYLRSCALLSWGLWLVDFMCQIGLAVVPRYSLKHFTKHSCDEILKMRLAFKNKNLIKQITLKMECVWTPLSSWRPYWCPFTNRLWAWRITIFLVLQNFEARSEPGLSSKAPFNEDFLKVGISIQSS